MSKYFLALSFLLLGAIVGCDTVTPLDNVTDVASLVWLPGGNGMVGFVQQYARDPNIVTTAEYSLTKVSESGSIEHTISTSKKSTVSFAPEIFVSPDGTRAMTQLDTTLYSVDLQSGTSTAVLSRVYVFTVSPDLTRAVVTSANPSQPVKTIKIMDLTTSPATEVAHFLGTNVSLGRGLWLTDSTFALTIEESQKRHIIIYNTAGDSVAAYDNAEVSFHASGYSRSANRLFVLTTTSGVTRGIDMVDLATGSRVHYVTLPERVEGFDVSASGKLLTYIVSDTSGNRSLIALNTTTLKKATITDEDVLFDVISPAEDRVAYVVFKEGFTTEINVRPITLP